MAFTLQVTRVTSVQPNEGNNYFLDEEGNRRAFINDEGNRRAVITP